MFDFSSQNITEVRATARNLSAPARKYPLFEQRYRAFDLVLAVLALPFVVIAMLAVAVVIKLDDPSAPVLFRQRRYGLNGKPFNILKFRTMVPNAEALKATLLSQSEDQGAGFKLENDPRVTRPGRLLRKTYLDELPQIWNVLRGEMAFVGPRANSFPPEKLESWQRRRLAVLPGITGSWQVMTNKPTEFVTRCLIDIEYIAAKSLRGDCGILLRTVQVALLRKTGF